MGFEVSKSDEEWRRVLTPEQYRITREKGTERPFSGQYWSTTTPGLSRCFACGNALIRTDTNVASACAWPRFWVAGAEGGDARQTDRSQ